MDYTEEGFLGSVDGQYILFPTEQEYLEYLKEEKERTNDFIKQRNDNDDISKHST